MQNDEVSRRSIGVLEFIQEKNPTKTYFEENIKSYLENKYDLPKNNSLASHFYRPLEFVGLIFWNDDRMYLSIDGKNFLKNIREEKYQEAYISYILQLLKTKYPNTATKDVKLNLFPYRIMFKLLLEKDNIEQDDFRYKIPYIKSMEDINNYDNINGSSYEKIISWTISYLLKWDVLITENNIYKINENKFPIIKDILSKIEFEDMFFEIETLYQKSELRKKYKRNQNLIKEVISKSNFKCFFDSSHITFETNQMENYLEGHHIIPMCFSDSFKFNLDIEENLVPLCPNCHRKIHLSTDKTKKELIKDFYHKTDLNKFNVSESDLINIYISN